MPRRTLVDVVLGDLQQFDHPGTRVGGLACCDRVGDPTMDRDRRLGALVIVHRQAE